MDGTIDTGSFRDGNAIHMDGAMDGAMDDAVDDAVEDAMDTERYKERNTLELPSMARLKPSRIDDDDDLELSDPFQGRHSV
ncbi:hypothetical protein V8C44DRAFT_343997 [Trichoderma aethiopicum]